MTAKIYVFRHFESVDNRDNVFSGIRDVELTENGQKQVKLFAQKFKNIKIDLAFTSPLKRTKDSLNFILRYHPNVKTVVDDRLIEKDYGKLSGHSKSEYIRKHPKLSYKYRRSYSVPPPGGESMKQVDKRVTLFIKDMLNIIQKEQAKTVFVSAHSNSIRPIRKYFEDLTNKQMMQIETGQGECFVYTIQL